MGTKTWTRGDGQTEEVEVGSAREQELNQKLHEAGLWASDDPNLPEGCITVDELMQVQKRDENGRWYIDQEELDKLKKER